VPPTIEGYGRNAYVAPTTPLTLEKVLNMNSDTLAPLLFPDAVQGVIYVEDDGVGTSVLIPEYANTGTGDKIELFKGSEVEVIHLESDTQFPISSHIPQGKLLEWLDKYIVFYYTVTQDTGNVTPSEQQTLFFKKKR